MCVEAESYRLKYGGAANAQMGSVEVNCA
jgi:hypothetical protein